MRRYGDTLQAMGDAAAAQAIWLEALAVADGLSDPLALELKELTSSAVNPAGT